MTSPNSDISALLSRVRGALEIYGRAASEPISGRALRVISVDLPYGPSVTLGRSQSDGSFSIWSDDEEVSHFSALGSLISGSVESHRLLQEALVTFLAQPEYMKKTE